MEESERRYQELIRTSPAPINLFNASGEIIWGNDAVVDLLGLDSQDELVGRSIFDFIHPDNRYTAESELAAVVNEKEPAGPTPMRLNPVEGTERTIRVATAPGQYGGEDIGQAVVIDITELDRMKEELEREKEFIETALDTIDDVFYVIDTTGTLERWNDAFIDVTGYTTEEVQTREIEDFFIDDHADRVSESISRAFVDGEDIVEAIVRTKSGERIPYEFRKQRIVKDDSVVGLVGIGRDITQQKTREQHLKTVDYLLQHHLRNQCNIIRGNTDLVTAQGEDGDDQRATAIHEAVDRMISLFNHHQEITTQILFGPSRVQIDIVEVLDALLAELRGNYPNAELTLISPDSAPVVAIPYVKEAFYELVWNALKHNTGDTPEVTITVDADPTPTRVRLTDNGPLISKYEYEFMKNPALLDSTSHPTGLGLWAANLAITYSRGTFTLEETAESGNRILIELPSPTTDWKA